MEKKGNISKNGLNNMGKWEPKPVTKIKIVVTQKKRSILSGFFSRAPRIARITAIKPK